MGESLKNNDEFSVNTDTELYFLVKRALLIGQEKYFR